MQTKRAIALANFIDEAYKVFEKVYKQEVEDKKELDKYKRKFTESTFEEYYLEFEEELKENIDEYLNVITIYDYIISCFEKFEQWQPFYSEDNQRIMKQGYELKFLIKLKSNIEKYGLQISRFCDTDQYEAPGFMLTDFYKKRIRGDKNQTNNQTDTKADPDNRFDFQLLKSECVSINKLIEKIKHINERLFDFEQWQLQYDEIEDDFFDGKRYRYSNMYYPKFILLCKSELKRLEKLLEIEKKDLTHKALETNPIIIQSNVDYIYKWNATDTDLLELVTALYKKEAFERKDGKAIQRKELTDYFQKLLGMEIKDVEGKLTRATGRNDNTPFLDGLKAAFKNYKVEKEVKQNQRK